MSQAPIARQVEEGDVKNWDAIILYNGLQVKAYYG